MVFVVSYTLRPPSLYYIHAYYTPLLHTHTRTHTHINRHYLSYSPLVSLLPRRVLHAPCTLSTPYFRGILFFGPNHNKPFPKVQLLLSRNYYITPIYVYLFYNIIITYILWCNASHDDIILPTKKTNEPAATTEFYFVIIRVFIYVQMSLHHRFVYGELLRSEWSLSWVWCEVFRLSSLQKKVRTTNYYTHLYLDRFCGRYILLFQTFIDYCFKQYEVFFFWHFSVLAKNNTSLPTYIAMRQRVKIYYFIYYSIYIIHIYGVI